MTIDEMIATCEEGSKTTWNGRPTQGALEHRQLAEWLKELQAHRESWMKVVSAIDQHTDIHSDGEVYPSDKTDVPDYYGEIWKCRPKEGDAE